VNLFHGFQPFQYSAFTLVPRNFRMATYNEDLLLPNGQVTHFTLEGDEQIFNGDESLRIQAAPNSTVFNTLPNSFNPEGEEFNSTVTYPLYALGPVRPPLASPYYEFDSTAGLNSDGYNIFRPGADAQAAGRVGRRIGETWGVDVDTHYIGHTTLQNFALPGQEAERITTRYSSGQDMVILVSEVISVTNFPIADLEVFINQSGNFKVGGTGAYQIEVRNNGNGIGADGQATGEIKVAVRLPEGFSFASSAAVGGTGWSCDVALSPGAFTCTYDIAATHSGGELPQGASLPLITANVQLAAPSASPFPLLNNERKIVARLLHSGGSCDATTIGFIPNPENCVRSPQFDNRNDLQGGILDINNLVDKSENNNNVHSINTNVKGIETNLRIVKTVIDGLETNQPGQYLLTVTNLGPDATTFPITVTDEQPTGVTFTGVSNAAG
jgi:hypothetical protein